VSEQFQKCDNDRGGLRPGHSLLASKGLFSKVRTVESDGVGLIV